VKRPRDLSDSELRFDILSAASSVLRHKRELERWSGLLGELETESLRRREAKFQLEFPADGVGLGSLVSADAAEIRKPDA